MDADVAHYEEKANPDGQQVDSNPVAQLRAPGRDVVVDAGGNSLLAVGRHPRIHELAIFPTTMVDASPFVGAPLGGGTGSVVRIPAGGGSTHTTVVDNLEAPYGILLSQGSLYVSTQATSPNEGQVVRVGLHRRH